MARKKIEPYYSGWSDSSDILDSFKAPETALDGATVLFAAYEGGSYEGDATVIFKKGRKLFEASGSHCSCYGLEDQWGPGEIDAKQLLTRELSTYSYSTETIAAFKQLAKELNRKR